MELIDIKSFPMKKLEVNGSIFAYYEIDKSKKILYLGIMETVIARNQQYNENLLIVLIQKIEDMHFEKIGFLNVYSQPIDIYPDKEILTNGGYPVNDFKALENPIERGTLEPHIYSGYISDPINKSESDRQLITWDRFGRCSNFSRKDCFLRHKTVN